jgi:hypothetical protein
VLGTVHSSPSLSPLFGWTFLVGYWTFKLRQSLQGHIAQNLQKISHTIGPFLTIIPGMMEGLLMSKGRILVTGASGFLGWNLLREPWSGWEWTGCSNRHDPGIPGLDLLQTDLTLPGAICGLLDTAQPDVVIHTAAATDLNACEAEPGRTGRINAEVPSHLARQCADRGVHLVRHGVRRQ